MVQFGWRDNNLASTINRFNRCWRESQGEFTFEFKNCRGAIQTIRVILQNETEYIENYQNMIKVITNIYSR